MMARGVLSPQYAAQETQTLAAATGKDPEEPRAALAWLSSKST